MRQPGTDEDRTTSSTHTRQLTDLWVCVVIIYYIEETHLMCRFCVLLYLCIHINEGGCMLVCTRHVHSGQPASARAPCLIAVSESHPSLHDIRHGCIYPRVVFQATLQTVPSAHWAHTEPYTALEMWVEHTGQLLDSWNICVWTSWFQEFWERE